MSGSSAVPNTFTAAQGLVPASQLDANWAALVTYINAREVDSGTLAARPVGVDGQWYFATDVAGGQLFFNAGGFWVPSAPAVDSGVIVPVPVSQGGTGLTAAGVNSTILMADATVAAGVRYAPGPTAALFFNQAASQTAGQTLFWGPWAGDAAETSAFVQRILPFDCWLRNLGVRATAAPAGTQDIKVTVRLNGVSTTLTATITGTTDRAANSATIIAAKAGDLLTVQVTFSSGAASSTGTGSLELTPR